MANQQQTTKPTLITLLLIVFSIIGIVYTSSAQSRGWGQQHDLWYTMRQQFHLKVDTRNPQIKAQIAWYRKHQQHLNQLFKQAVPYLYYVQQEVAKRELPGELALIPMIESAYNPFSYSHAGASGLWQLMPGTGTGLGLKQNWWYDGRRDIYASTKAALDYLSYLQRFFDGDWSLAIAAYDSGEGTVQQARRRNAKVHKATDFWSLALPHETRIYVPRLLALAAIIHHPSRYGITLPTIINRPYFARITLGYQIDLAKAAKMAEVSLTELYHLNPGYNHWTSDPEGPNHLVLPIDRLDTFKQNLAKQPQPPQISWQRHKVVKGDSLGRIAHHYHTTIAQLKNINKLTSDTIHPDQHILITPNTQEVPATTLANQQQLLKKQQHYGPHKVIHQVAKNETLGQIAHRYHVRTPAIRFWNQLKRKQSITPGQRLVIWTSIKHQRVTRPKHYYQVKIGDTLSEIAHQLHTTTAKLKQWNKLQQTHTIHPNQKLVYFKPMGSSI